MLRRVLFLLCCILNVALSIAAAEEFHVSGAVWLAEDRLLAKVREIDVPELTLPIHVMQIDERIAVEQIQSHQFENGTLLFLHNAAGGVYGLFFQNEAPDQIEIVAANAVPNGFTFLSDSCGDKNACVAYAEIDRGIFVKQLFGEKRYFFNSSAREQHLPKHRHLVAADIYGTGRPAFVFPHYDDSLVTVGAFVDERITLQSWQLLPKNGSWSSVYAGRFNEDRFEDLLLIDSVNHRAVSALSDGRGVFRKVFWEEELYLDYQDKIKIADLNGDGLSDLLIIRPANNLLEIRYTAQPQEATVLQMADIREAAAGDIDCDGRNDLVLVSKKPAHFEVALNRGSGIFERHGLLVPEVGTPTSAKAVLLQSSSGRCEQILFAVSTPPKQLERASGDAFYGPALIAPQSGVQLAARPDKLTVTGEDGSYRFDSLSSGAYTIAPFALGSSFEPSRQAVQVASDNLSGINFFTFIPKTRALVGTPEEIGTDLDPRPQPCIGYRISDHQWGRNEEVCPAHHAVIELDDASPGSPTFSSVNSVLCCPLPSREILSEHSVWATERCPAGFVVTSNARNGLFRCTQINSDSYALGPANLGGYWGLGESYRGESTAVRKLSLDPAVRSGIGRLSRYSWDTDGCLGRPPGSLLTGMWGKNCSQTEFRVLLHKENGKAVQLFPACRTLSNKFDPSARCE